VVVNAGDATLGALELEARYHVSFWDGLVIHAAQVAPVTGGCRRVLSISTDPV
jgi:predicted nucleic acid-binding protein